MKLKMTLVLFGATLVLVPAAMRAQGDGITALETLGSSGDVLQRELTLFQRAQAKKSPEFGPYHFKECGKKYLIKFYSNGKEVPSEVVGDPKDICEPFGGNLAYTPKYHLYFYVNVNVAGSIDLDRVDKVFEDNVPPDTRNDVAKGTSLSVVTRDWMRYWMGMLGGDPESYAATPPDNSTLFISERALSEGKLQEILQKFYKPPEPEQKSRAVEL